MRFKGDDHCFSFDFGCFLSHLAEDPLMSQMNSVKVSQSDNRVPERSFQLIESQNYFHISAYRRVVVSPQRHREHGEKVFLWRIGRYRFSTSPLAFSQKNSCRIQKYFVCRYLPTNKMLFSVSSV